jgi:hypothetical protein
MPDGAEVFRLPEWNDLTNEQRVAICDEAELWADPFIGRDAALALYNTVRNFVQVEPPALMVRFAEAGGVAP